MAMFVKDLAGKQHEWHVGEPLPACVQAMRVVTFQADGDELEAVISALRSRTPPLPPKVFTFLHYPNGDVCDSTMVLPAVGDKITEKGRDNKQIQFLVSKIDSKQDTVEGYGTTDVLYEVFLENV